MYNFVIYNDGFKGLDELFFLDIKNRGNVAIIKRDKLFTYNIMNTLCKVHFSHKINNIIELPLKSLWYSRLFKDNFENNNAEYCFIFTPGWYYPGFIQYLKKCYPNSKFVFYFSDTISSKKEKIKKLSISYLKDNFDLVLSYNKEDVEKYKINYSSIYYSKLPQQRIEKYKKFDAVDVVYIGAARNRLNDISAAFRKFKAAGLSCYFYVVVEKGREFEEIDGITYSESILPFEDYLGRTFSAKCVMEILDKDTVGSTLRFWEAIMYNKKLITNYPYVKESKFYNNSFIHYYKEINDIDPTFVTKKNNPDFKYSDENSPVRFIELIEKKLSKEMDFL